MIHAEAALGNPRYLDLSALARATRVDQSFPYPSYRVVLLLEGRAAIAAAFPETANPAAGRGLDFGARFRDFSRSSRGRGFPCRIERAFDMT
jgi:hypothetical protein